MCVVRIIKLTQKKPRRVVQAEKVTLMIESQGVRKEYAEAA